MIKFLVKLIIKFGIKLIEELLIKSGIYYLNEKRDNMKYYKRLKVYKSSNNLFNPETMEAHSYSWWKYVQRWDNKVFFNWHSYSNSTCRHQWKTNRVLHDLNIKTYSVYTRESLNMYLEDFRKDLVLSEYEKTYNACIRRLWSTKPDKVDINEVIKELNDFQNLMKVYLTNEEKEEIECQLLADKLESLVDNQEKRKTIVPVKKEIKLEFNSLLPIDFKDKEFMSLDNI